MGKLSEGTIIRNDKGFHVMTTVSDMAAKRAKQAAACQEHPGSYVQGPGRKVALLG